MRAVRIHTDTARVSFSKRTFRQIYRDKERYDVTRAETGFSIPLLLSRWIGRLSRWIGRLSSWVTRLRSGVGWIWLLAWVARLCSRVAWIGSRCPNTRVARLGLSSDKLKRPCLVWSTVELVLGHFRSLILV